MFDFFNNRLFDLNRVGKVDIFEKAFVCVSRVGMCTASIRFSIKSLYILSAILGLVESISKSDCFIICRYSSILSKIDCCLAVSLLFLRDVRGFFCFVVLLSINSLNFL